MKAYHISRDDLRKLSEDLSDICCIISINHKLRMETNNDIVEMENIIRKTFDEE